ncbi:54S ribosomal protein subunit [Trichophyton mentagrophytes]|nr:54S ribosomal protein subunit [Trichophyton mentagrophytes]
MASVKSALRPTGCCANALKELKQLVPRRQFLHTVHSPRKQKIAFPTTIPEQFISQIPKFCRPGKGTKELKVHPPPAFPYDTCKDPIAAFTAEQLSILDPTGARKALFDPKNRQGAKVGDILRVTFKNGDPFAGVCLNIRQRGVDTAFLLRNKLTRISCEMWVKAYSPNVVGVEVVQRTEKRKRRAKLTYMRKPAHDIGSVENIVRNYLRTKRILAGGGDQRSRKR